MSLPNQDDYDEEIEQQPQESSVIRQLRAENKRLADEANSHRAEAERASELERQVAFYQAKLPDDLNDAKQKAIMATATEHTAEGFRKAAEDLGFIAPPAPSVSVDELGVQAQIAQAGVGGTIGIDESNYAAEIAAATNENEVRAVMAKYNRPVA